MHGLLAGRDVNMNFHLRDQVRLLACRAATLAIVRRPAVSVVVYMILLRAPPLNVIILLVINGIPSISLFTTPTRLRKPCNEARTDQLEFGL